MKLKFKLLLGIFLLLVISTGTNTFYSVNSFVEDKKAYLLESVLNKSQQISDQVSSEFLAIDYLADLYSTKTNIANGSRKSENYLASIKTDTLNKNPEIIYKNEESPYLDLDSLNDFVNEVVTKDESPIINSLIISYFNKEIILHKTFINNEDKIYVTQIFNIKSISDSLNTNPNIHNTIFFHNKKSNLIGKNIIEGNQIDTFLKSNIQKQSLEIKTGLDDTEENFLLSMVKNSKYEFIVTSAISTKIAFSTTKTIITKSVLFSLALLGIFIILGIIFSSQITSPIQELTMAANNTSNGIYDYKENISTRDELKILGVSFELMNKEIRNLIGAKQEMIEQLDTANSELDNYNKNLEKMVADRTKSLNESNNFITAMINSLDQGLVVFDSKLNIKPIFTNVSKDIFNMDPKNKTLPELLRKNDPSDIAKLEQWSQVTFTNLLPFESAAGLAPSDLQFGNSIDDPDYKFVDIKYFPMKNSEQQLQNIVAVATDKTSAQINDYNFKKQEAYVQMILKVLNNKSSFQSFSQEVHQILENLKSCYDLKTGELNLELAMMLFHTLNGGFGLYRAYDLQKLARANEQFIVDTRPLLATNDDAISMAEALNDRVKRFKYEFMTYLKELDSKLGTTFSSNQANKEIPMRVLKDYFMQLDQIAEGTESPLLRNVADVFENNFLKSPVRSFLKSYEELCQQTAVKIGKELHPLKYINPDLMLNPEKFDSFFSTIIHLFRNNLDHGIEMPSRRRELGKDPMGLITIESIENQDGITISIMDDGAGINPEIIRNRWLKINPDFDINSESDEEIIYKIFEPNFSTKDTVTELSGRGVGMSAIKDVVDQMNGTITIKSVVDTGSKFIFYFPN